MRIAIVSTLESVPWTGCEELWAATAAAARAEGHDVFCSVVRWPSTPPKLAKLQTEGAHILARRRRRLPMFDNFISRFTPEPVRLPRPAQLGFASAFRAIFDVRADVILVSAAGAHDYFHFKDLISWLNAAATPYVVVAQLNFDAYPFEARFYREGLAFFRNAAHVGFVSEHNLRAAERQLATSLTNASVVQNPVNLTDTSIVTWPDAGPAKFASVARLEVNHKGHDLLLEALSAPHWPDRDWTLSLYGSGPDLDYVKRLVAHFGLTERVLFKGHAADVRAIWAEHQLGILASRWEGTPLALIEAMLCGRPSVVTDVGGNAEWTEDGASGYVAPGATGRSLAAALERAWQDRTNWPARGAAAHTAAIGKLDPNPGASLLRILEAAASRTEQPVSTPVTT